MTREEAIAELQEEKALYETDICQADDGTPDGKIIKAIDMAIEALSAEYEDYEHATLVDIKEPLKVVVVRCKDCYHYDKGENDSESWQYCRFLRHDTSDYNFCSWAERREP